MITILQIGIIMPCFSAEAKLTFLKDAFIWKIYCEWDSFETFGA